MTYAETGAEAWERMMGTRFDLSREACTWFLTGWNAGKGRA